MYILCKKWLTIHPEKDAMELIPIRFNILILQSLIGNFCRRRFKITKNINIEIRLTKIVAKTKPGVPNGLYNKKSNKNLKIY